jgi:tripartite ATP-independent transporter DctM subunit
MMDWPLAALLLLGGVSLLMLLGIPVALAFLGVNIVGAIVFLGGEPGLRQLIRNSVASVTSFSLTPIPLFILMGEVLFHTGLALKAIEAVDGVVRRVPGRLAVVAIIAGTIFSAISGSTIATTALLGSLLLPEMLKRGYEPRFAMGPIMGIGGVDMLIPPSALAVLLGSLAGISIAKLLVAGILPGLVMSALFIGYIVLRAWLTPSLAPTDDRPRVFGAAAWRPLAIYVFPLVLIFAAVVAAMSAGWATPTEAAAIGAAATIAVALLYRSLTWRTLRDALIGTAGISGVILFIIIGATAFSQILNFSGATGGLVSFVTGQRLSEFAVLGAMIAILLFLGCFVDQVSMMLITLPFYMPLVQLYGFDLVWFGVIYLICMQLGLLTPPFGLLLFTMKSVAPKGITMQQVSAAALPYVAIGLLVLALVVAIPGLATWMPAWLFR